MRDRLDIDDEVEAGVIPGERAEIADMRSACANGLLTAR